MNFEEVLKRKNSKFTEVRVHEVELKTLQPQHVVPNAVLSAAYGRHLLPEASPAGDH